ncbi:hypothetical protein LTR70_001217 [Exophiala xenobiotica]|uniref:Uncharacterized protein n=1 Tax=Lithohypha guttulata TaxID=1690604 RepID=A0ABR0KKF3_9EURO|nr:hypothetical protein LTR24_001468 [Lithohypha guttulata]KAK5328192.1 hypothetical protein LTR70_001217 [Exophiala xenobiotica]
MASANTLYIPDQAALYDIRASNQSRAMGVYQLDQSGVRGLQFGRRVEVGVDTGNGEVKKLRGRPTLRGLTKFFPAILRALRDHNKKGSGETSLIVLPNHDISAYNKIMGWYYASVTAGKVVLFNRVNANASTAYTAYTEVQLIAIDLDTGYLINAMTGRMNAMSDW